MKEQEIIHNTQREIILGYYNKIFLNKLSVEEILQTLEADIAFLGQQDATIQVNNLLGLSEEKVSVSDRDKFAIGFVNWIFEQGYFLNNPLDELLDLYKQSLTSKPQEK